MNDFHIIEWTIYRIMESLAHGIGDLQQLGRPIVLGDMKQNSMKAGVCEIHSFAGYFRGVCRVFAGSRCELQTPYWTKKAPCGSLRTPEALFASYTAKAAHLFGDSVAGVRYIPKTVHFAPISAA
jgi:hypothetical protein